MDPKATSYRRALCIAGISGSGKSCVGTELANHLGWPFVDADKHHTRAAREKINRGENVGEEYRARWLDRVIGATGELLSRGHNVVIACSAPKRAHRRMIVEYANELGEGADIMVAWLEVSEAELRRRLTERDQQAEHFATVKLLDSQLLVMEPPAEDEEDVVTINAEGLSVCELAQLIWNKVPGLHVLSQWTCRVPGSRAQDQP